LGPLLVKVIYNHHELHVHLGEATVYSVIYPPLPLLTQRFPETILTSSISGAKGSMKYRPLLVYTASPVIKSKIRQVCKTLKRSNMIYKKIESKLHTYMKIYFIYKKIYFIYKKIYFTYTLHILCIYFTYTLHIFLIKCVPSGAGHCSST
jgi:hypothetical protein